MKTEILLNQINDVSIILLCKITYIICNNNKITLFSLYFPQIFISETTHNFHSFRIKLLVEETDCQRLAVSNKHFNMFIQQIKITVIVSINTIKFMTLPLP